MHALCALDLAGQHLDKPHWSLQVPVAEAPATLPGQMLQQIAVEFQAIQDPKQRMQVWLLYWYHPLQ